MRCWPVGRPRDWVGWSRAKVKMRVSQETVFLAWRMAFVQALGLRKVGRGALESESVEGGGSVRALRAVDESAPMW